MTAPRASAATTGLVASARPEVSLLEECFQAAQNEAGLDHYQVRRYESWYRYIILAVTRAALAGDDTIVASSANEIRRMLTALTSPLTPMSLPATATTRSLSTAGY